MSVNDYCSYNQRYQVLICKQCKYCLVPGLWIGRHFREKHKVIPLKLRTDIISFSQTVALVEPSNPIIPPKDNPPIELLDIITDGKMCRICGYCSGSLLSIQKHCREEHNWKKEMDIMWETTSIQTFFQGIYSRYFPVKVQEYHSNTIDKLIESILESTDQLDLQRQNQFNVIQDNPSTITLTPWLRRTGWTRRYVGRDMERLVSLTKKPLQGEVQLFHLWGRTEAFLRHCYKGVQDIEARGWELVLFWMASPLANEEDTRPFRTYFVRETINVYISYWQRYICFCLRAMEDDEESGAGFTEVQKVALNKLRELVFLREGTTEEWESTIMEVSVKLIKHSDYSDVSSSLVYFCGIIGFNVDNHQWQHPEHYTPFLAGIQFCLRLILLEYSLPQCERNDERNFVQQDPLRQFKSVRDEWLVQGKPSPFNHLHRLMNYGLAAGKDSLGRTRVRWSHDAQILFYEDRLLKMTDWKRFIYEMIDYLEGLLSQRLLFRLDGLLPEVDLYSLVDNPSRHDAGFYFALNQKSMWRDARQSILRNLRQTEEWDKLVEMTPDGLEFIKGGIDEYEYWDEKFREGLFILMITTCGLPGRTTEMTSLRYMNTTEGDRNIYVEDGQVMFVTEYHKSQAMTDSLRIIPRFLPIRVSEMFVLYLSQVIPFRFLINLNTPTHGFLFGDKNGPWSTSKLTAALTHETQKRIGFRMTNRDYRHIAIAIDRKFIRPEAVGFHDDSDSEDDNPHDLMSTHSTRIANNKYARFHGLTKSLTPESIDIFRQISDKWVTWQGLVARKARSESGKNLMPIVLESLQSRVAKITRRLYGATFRWKSEKQKEAVFAVLEGRNPLIINLPTGMGKSSAFLIPSCFENAGSTVVITSLIALGKDLLRRCKEVNIDAIIFGESMPRPATIIIVITETAATSSFQSFAAELFTTGKLERIVYDEAHKLVTDSGYRLRIMDSRVLSLPVQFVFMTATYPPSFASAFEKEMLIRDPYYIKEPSFKPNNRYTVLQTNNLRYDLVTLVQRSVNYYGYEGKVLVFCRTIVECKEYAMKLHCGMYYSSMEGKERILGDWISGALIATGSLGAGIDIENIREVIHVGEPYGLIDFYQEVGRGGRNNEIVKSTILIDTKELIMLKESDPYTRTVDGRAMAEFIVTEECRNLILTEYLNGREDTKTCSEIGGQLCDNCQSGVDNSAKKRQREQDLFESIEIKKIRTNTRRMDLVQEDVMARESSWAMIDDVLREIGSGCPVCWLLEQVDDDHTVFDCPVLIQCLGRSYRYWRGLNINYGSNNSICWRCIRPGDRCDAYTDKVRCSTQDCVTPIIVFVFLTKDSHYHSLVREVARREFKDLKDFCEWAGQKMRILNENGCNAFSLFNKIVARKRESS